MNETKGTTEMQTDPDVAEIFAAPDVVKAFTALGEALKQAGEVFGRVIRAYADAIAAILHGVNFAGLLKAAKMQNALKEAPPRVRHLAKHGKKYRTRKKNINRALRDYEKRRMKE